LPACSRGVFGSRLATAILMVAILGGPHAAVSASAGAAQQEVTPSAGRDTLPLLDDWRFHLGDLTGAQEPDFDEGGWQNLDIPHDWSIAGEFDKDNPTRGAGGFLPAGVGWYRKHFTLPESAKDRRVVVEFDGVMANSDIWINGHHLGRRPFGYVSFQYDLTGHLRFGDGAPNVLAVRVDDSKQPASRWYSGAGIYRKVRLTITDRVYIAPWGIFMTTPEAAAEQAVVEIATEIANDTDTARELTLNTTLVGPNGKIASKADTNVVLPPARVSTVRQKITVTNPARWDLDKPQLYQAESRLTDAGRLVDNVTTPFGIRAAEFRADSGFWLNGRNLKIKGVCLHHDGGALGAAVPASAWERRIRRLQQLGVNAIRTAHNPPTPELLELCDRMGMLVMDEFFDCWTKGKEPYDYHLYFDEWAEIDARDTIRRDRNHPSVILYSVGNEIRDTPDAELAKRVLGKLVTVCHRTDPTRPVTQALFRPNVSHDYDNGLADMLDVIGTNYRDLELLAAWRDDPTRKIIGTEQTQDRNTWLNCRDHPQHAGQFLWAGIDYLGESRRWPVTTFNGGLLDRTGDFRPAAFERQSWWSDKPMVRAMRRIAPTEDAPTDPGYEVIEWRRRQVLFPDWTPYELGPHVENVEVVSNCEQVELVLNGKSLGSKPLSDDARPRNWDVDFAPGTLVAIGRNGGEVVARDELRTAGSSSKIELTTETETLTPTWDDVAYIQATVVDANGVRVPRADDIVRFSVDGPAKVIAVDNGSIVSHEPFQSNKRHAFQGRCVAIVRATEPGRTITINAEADGLEPGQIQLETTAADAATR
jgi:beta-galactosidase